jgi:hypothetical protein
MTYIKIPTEVLLETLLDLLKNGIDWGARGGAALALGLLKHDRERIAYELANCLPEERDIGVRLRLADALGHLGWHDKQIDSILKKALSDEHHFHTRWKLTEAYALLTRKEDFIHERIIQPILGDEMQARCLRSQEDVPQTSSFASDDKNRLEAFAILCKLEYYTDELMHQIIERLTSFSQPLCKQALTYLSAAPSIPKADRPALNNYLNTVIHDDSADGILRNRAFETLYNIYDLLSGDLDE